MVCGKLKFKITAYFVICVHGSILNIVFKINCTIKMCIKIKIETHLTFKI